MENTSLSLQSGSTAPQTLISSVSESDGSQKTLEETHIESLPLNKVSDEANLQSKNAIVNAVAGACAGASAKTIVAPIERVKLLMQLQGSIDKSSTHRQISAIKVALDVYYTQGVIAFWRGNTPNVIRQGGTTALNFMLMDSYKKVITPLLDYAPLDSSKGLLSERVRRRGLFSSFLSGGLAGGTTTTVLYPIEFLRTRLAMDMGKSVETRKYPRGMRDVFLNAYRVDGIRGLYQGYGIAVAGVILYKGLHLGGYDAVKNELLYFQNKLREETIGKRNDDIPSDTDKIPLGQRFLLAQFVSIVAGTACYPIDSVRRRLMMQAGIPSIIERKYKNSIDCFQKVAKEEGIRGFYLGIGPNIIRSFGGALLLVGYDVFKGMII